MPSAAFTRIAAEQHLGDAARRIAEDLGQVERATRAALAVAETAPATIELRDAHLLAAARGDARSSRGVQRARQFERPPAITHGPARARHRQQADRLLAAWILALSLVFSALCRRYGATATLAGRVVDESGGVVAHVEVVIVDPATGLERKTETSERGEFVFPGLRAGALSAHRAA